MKKEIITVRILENVSFKELKAITDFRWPDMPGRYDDMIRSVTGAKLLADHFFITAENWRGDIVGCVSFFRNEQDPHKWYYADLGVAKTYRRNGIAVKMVRAGIETLKDRSAGALYTSVEFGNTPSLRLQEKLGFIKIPTEPFDGFIVNGQQMFCLYIPANLCAVPFTDSLLTGFLSIMKNPENLEALHGIDRSVREWREIFSHDDPDEQNFMVCKGLLPLAWLRINGLESKDMAWISMLVVADGAKRQGVGAFAVGFAERFAREKGFCKMGIHTTEDNLPAQNLYKKCGYTVTEYGSCTTGDGAARMGFTFEKVIDDPVRRYARNSLEDRLKTKLDPQQEMIFLPSLKGEVFRIIHSGGCTVVRTKRKYRDRLSDYLTGISVGTEIRNPSFYISLLNALGLCADDFPAEPVDELVEKEARYSCFRSLEFVCRTDSFIQAEPAAAITEIRRGQEDFLLAENFGDTMYCVRRDGVNAAVSFYRPNHDLFENTYAMQVSVKKAYRGNGYGKAAASAATADICKKQGLTLWVCHPENTPSIKIAEALGYAFLGGEIRITK